MSGYKMIGPAHCADTHTRNPKEFPTFTAHWRMGAGVALHRPPAFSCPEHAERAHQRRSATTARAPVFGGPFVHSKDSDFTACFGMHFLI
mmetsp:Transcript_72697/g.122399  ORF Transcript_72697/g.122399 Transcript_72697/m.122399 type:complete len:90 (+) Transcript_72697:347-616(+)